MSWLSSVRFHLTLAVALCAGLTVAFWWNMTSHEHVWWHWLAHWLLSVNLVTFAYFGIDKLLAMRSWWRVPEMVLHTLTAIGGSPAAILAMWFFHHKTIKPSFRILFWSIVLVQIGLVLLVMVKLL